MIADLVAAVVKRIWLVALTFVVANAIAVVTLIRQVPVYRSTATVELSQPQNDDSELQYQTRITTRLATATTAGTLGAARETLGRPIEEVTVTIAAISAKRIEGTSLVQLTVDGLDPVLAADFANSWATAFLASLPEAEKPAARVVERALPSSCPSTPRKMETIFRSGLVGLAIGLAIAISLSWMELQGAKQRGKPER